MPTITRHSLTRTAFAALLSFAGASGVSAQTPETPTEAPAQRGTAGTEQAAFSDHDLRSFANAVTEVSKINLTYQPQVEAAASEQERADIEVQARERMVDAIEDEGLSLDKYNGIILAARADPVVAQRIDRMLQEAMQETMN